MTLGKKVTMNFDLSGLPKTMAWYPVVTVYGMEDKFAADLITAVRNSDMPEIHDAVEQVFVPVTYTRTQYTSRGTTRTRTTKTAGVWSMYAFIHCKMSLTLWDFIRTSSGLMMMLASAGMPVPIPDAEMEKVLSACTFDGYEDDEIDHLMRQRRLTHVVEIDQADVEAEKAYKEMKAEAQAKAKAEAEAAKEREKAERKAEREAERAERKAAGIKQPRRRKKQDDEDDEPVNVRRIVHAGAPVVDVDAQARRDARKHERAVAVQANASPSLIGPYVLAENGDILLEIPGTQPLDAVTAEPLPEPEPVQVSNKVDELEPLPEVNVEPVVEPEPKPEPELEPELQHEQVVKPTKKKTSGQPLSKKTRMSALERFAARAAQAKAPKTTTVNKVNTDKLLKANDEVEVIDGLMAGKHGYVVDDQSTAATEVKVLLNDYDMPFVIDISQVQKV